MVRLWSFLIRRRCVTISGHVSPPPKKYHNFKKYSYLFIESSNFKNSVLSTHDNILKTVNSVKM